MELIRGAHNLKPEHRGCAATIGNFDGVHLGHREVLDHLGAAARRHGAPAVVITFEPHPMEYLAPDRAPPRLSRLRDKLEALRTLSVDRVVCLRFCDRLASMPPESFVEDVLVKGLGVRFLMVGDDFRFGCHRRGDFDLLSGAGKRYGFEVQRMPTVDLDGARISSTRVRGALRRGDLDEARRLLGRSYRISGRVSRGDGLGRELGFPTANLPFRRHRAPLWGIFVVEVRGLSTVPLPAVASVGTRPTVGGRTQLLEVHVLDFDENLYGRHLDVEFLQRLRDEEAFESLAALKQQMNRDLVRTREYFSARTMSEPRSGAPPQ